MHKFKCPDGHEFEAKRNFYAHCPVCGKNAKRIYDGEPSGKTDSRSETKEDESKTKEESKNSESTEEADQNSKEKEQSSGESVQPKTDERKSSNSSTGGVKRVKVKRGQKAKSKEDGESKDESSKRSPAKKVKITKGAAPKVNKKIVTTRDRKLKNEQKEERATQWNRVRGFKLF